MKILNFGSLNIDHTYRVQRFGQPGETLPCEAYRRGPGGKGLNQSVALANAGLRVHHAGAVGEDGAWLLQYLQDRKVDTSLIHQSEDATGHAIIQVTDAGENSILIHAGANQTIPSTHITQAFEGFGPGDILVVQNEINDLPLIMTTAVDRQMKIVFNPAPFTESITNFYPLDLVNLFIINEIEGQQLTGEQEPMAILEQLGERYEEASVALTLGEKGAIYRNTKDMFKVGGHDVRVRDTTAAGDTFIGFFLSEYLKDKSPLIALNYANKAASICVTRPGAAQSIPHPNEMIG